MMSVCSNRVLPSAHSKHACLQLRHSHGFVRINCLNAVGSYIKRHILKLILLQMFSCVVVQLLSMWDMLVQVWAGKNPLWHWMPHGPLLNQDLVLFMVAKMMPWLQEADRLHYPAPKKVIIHVGGTEKSQQYHANNLRIIGG